MLTLAGFARFQGAWHSAAEAQNTKTDIDIELAEKGK